MSPRLLPLLLFTGLACTHATKADDASDQNVTDMNQAEPAQEQEEGSAPQLADPQHVGQRKGLISGGAKDPERVPVASSPAGLLKPGAEDKVREKLGPKAKGDGLRSAVQRFQREHDLPATGILDHRTVEELGLDPDELFVKAEDG